MSVGIERGARPLDAAVVRCAQILIWAFFLLTFSKFFEMAAQKLHSPIRPVLVYGTICACAAGTAAFAVVRSGTRAFSRAEVAYFVCFAITAAMMLIGYRGENIGPTFGGELIAPSHMPTSLGYAIWPALNLIIAASLFVFVRVLGLWRTLLMAAAVTLVIQLVTMEADMLWPATFGEANGRPAGWAKNANTASIVVTTLVALCLPLRISDGLSQRSVYALAVAVPALAFAGSRGGWVIGGALLIIVTVTWLLNRTPIRIPLAFLAAYVAILGSTLVLSPITNPPSVEPATAAGATTSTPPPSIVSPPPLTARVETAFDPGKDASMQMRLAAAKFFFEIGLSHPFGLGTGFSNKYATGPHNMPLKLWVDNGLPAALFYLVVLCLMAGIAWNRRSPALAALAGIGIVGSALSHTIFVEPQVFVLFSAALGAGIGRRAWPRGAG